MWNYSIPKRHLKKDKGNEVYEKLMKKIEQLTQDEKFMGYYGLEEKHKWHASKTNRLAKSMLEKKMDIEDVIYVTGLAIEEITSLM